MCDLCSPYTDDYGYISNREAAHLARRAEGRDHEAADRAQEAADRQEAVRREGGR